MGILISYLGPSDNCTLPSLTKCRKGHKWFSSFELYPFVVGSRKTVFEGMMYDVYIPNNYWSKRHAIVKCINYGKGTEEDVKAEVSGAIKAQEFAEGFSKKFDTVDKFSLKFQRPLAAVMDNVSVFNGIFRFLKGYDKVLSEGEGVLIEEKLEGEFVSFIYKNGGITSNCEAVLQAFCHYTYSASHEELVVSGLQGVKNGNTYTLSTPCIHSRSRQYGNTDAGEVGISSFFSHHECNDSCSELPKFSPTDLSASSSVSSEKPYSFEDTFPVHYPSKRSGCDSPEFSYTERSMLVTAEKHPPAYEGIDSQPPTSIRFQK
ncbi:alpha-protein kinase vwkA-like [Pecten maximus]|uniref:alpha-protein kinase vwkA-like n=1 Tax=Pecten maximus TaxID=6579 RepID=UPI0014590EE3|nr:alpha-protein kinase vwkA-like [Pecten maximus]